MTAADQTFERIPIETLLDRTRSMREQGCRLVQICATRLPDQIELTYSFDLQCQLISLRVTIPGADPRVPSISSVFWCAFLYENEIHDLFNIQVDGMSVDFHGRFYKTAVKFPFATVRSPSTVLPGGGQTPVN